MLLRTYYVPIKYLLRTYYVPITYLLHEYVLFRNLLRNLLHTYYVSITNLSRTRYVSIKCYHVSITYFRQVLQICHDTKSSVPCSDKSWGFTRTPKRRTRSPSSFLDFLKVPNLRCRCQTNPANSIEHRIQAYVVRQLLQICQGIEKMRRSGKSWGSAHEDPRVCQGSE